MKRFFLFLFASLLSISMFAAGETGKTKAQAIPYDWSTGIHVSSEAGVGKWYVVKLRKEDGGPFNANGKTDDGKININVSVVNPLNEEADINCTAYIGDNETNRHFKLAAGGVKSMTFGAGAFIKMGIDRVYLYLVMDVTVTEEEAQAHEAVNVNVTPVENENSVVFTPINFNWNGWAEGETKETDATVIPANTETWVKIVFDKETRLGTGETFVFTAKNMGAAATTIYAGISYDCPASSIQEDSRNMAANATIEKALDKAKLGIMPDSIYVRIKADQEIRLSAKPGSIPAPQGDPIFNVNGAIEVKLWDPEHPEQNVYTLKEGELVYKVAYNTLQADENYYRQIEVHNGGASDVYIVGKATKTFDADGDVYGVVSKTVTIPAGQTYYKKIDKTMQSAVGKGANDTIWALGPLFPNVTFKLTQEPVDPEYCKNATAFDWDDWNNQSANSYKWYSVDIADAKLKKADIVLTMETIGENDEANITVDLAAACALGEPTQSYSGKSKSTKKTLSYSLYKDNAANEMFVRVRTDKAIKVKAELLTVKTWDGSQWSGEGHTAPDLTITARIEGNLTITDGMTIKALGITLAGGKITIKNGGKLIVGKEGIKGSETVDQITIEKGGIILIDPAATTNNKPFVTAENTLKLGVQSATGHTLPEWHNFIALPIENREAAFANPAYYANWDRMDGWVATDGFRHPFVGYNVFAVNGSYYQDPAVEQTVSYKGQLAANQNVNLSLPANGWYAFGNSWTAPIPLSSIYSQLSGSGDDAAVHFYVDAPTDYSSEGLGTILDNYYIPATQEIASNLGIDKIKPMQGFFLHTESSYSVTLNYDALFDAYKTAASPAPKRVAADNRTMAAAVLSDTKSSDFVYMIEGEAGNASKMIGSEIAIYAENGLAQIANENLIGTILTIKTTEDTEYTLHFAWLNGETLYLKDLANGNIIAMTADSRYTFSAEPNTVSERFQVIGRHEVPTNIENGLFLDGANKRIENGKIVIIKNGVKYDVLGTQL